MRDPQLLAVPNVSEGRDAAAIAAVGAAFEAGGARILDVHSDADHHRTVFTLTASAGVLAGAVAAGAREAVARIDIGTHEGVHPRVGAVDVAPIVFPADADRGAAIAEALVLADTLGEQGVPVYLYGDLADGRTRASLRRPGGLDGLAPDFGPAEHASAGATLVAARPPLVAFNVELAAPATVGDARAIAALIREGGAEGIPGVRALGVPIRGGVAQVTTNLEVAADGSRATAAEIVAAVRAHAPVAAAELVALAPEAAFAGFPDDVALPGFEPDRHLIERVLGV